MPKHEWWLNSSNFVNPRYLQRNDFFASLTCDTFPIGSLSLPCIGGSRMKLLVSWFITAALLGCAPESDQTVQELSRCASSQQNPINYTYGEVRSWANMSASDFRAAAGLGDMKASIGAACARNSDTENCACSSPPSATAAPGDRAAWGNITTAQGNDRSNGSRYVCVGTRICPMQHQCVMPGPTTRTINRVLPHAALLLLNNDQHRAVYFFKGAPGQHCFAHAWTQACSSITLPAASNNWTATCSLNLSGSFERNSSVPVLARFTDITVRHRFSADVLLNGRREYTVGPTSYSDVGNGWDQAFFWTTVRPTAPGTWSVRVSVDPGTGTFYAMSSTSFVVR